MLDALLDQFGEMFLLAAEAARNERRTCGQGQRNRVDRRFDVTEGHAFCLHADAAGWRRLAGGQSINLVVHDDVEQIHIAAHRMNEMVAANPETVTVAARHQDG